MAGCNCNVGLSNTGRPKCEPIQSVTSSGELMDEDSTPTLLEKLKSDSCVEFVVYGIDVKGNLIKIKKV